MSDSDQRILSLVDQYLIHRSQLNRLASQAQMASADDRVAIDAESKALAVAFAAQITEPLAALSRNDRLDLVWITEDEARRISDSRVLMQVSARHALGKMLPNPSELELAANDRLRRVLLRR